MLEGFKKFIMRGNVIDLAVAVVIGAAFSPIVKALTDEVIYPLIGAIFGKPNFDELWVPVLNGAEIRPFTVVTAVLNFLIIAAALYFMVVLPMNKVNAKLAKPEDVPDEVKDPQLIVLEEILGTLKNNDAPATGQPGGHRV
ncbi:large conductance mechanosensitive channel protein MscL [Corynebacterium mendelii]|uniref:Large-conductance mechanosensitive channel n=1 Tax=Corynebacterium mendelii TaxID=2765362 RepID=A0A939IY03_9CORY|nr:large conductance mechanosensitive channel protein MscL [Corynebacterium mendelii]